jgi:predicted ribosome quality control (RQC) complex YloA/Tae2 family protein
MAYDGLLCGAVAREFASLLPGSKIEKVMQPESDMLILQIKTASERKKLLIDVSSAGSRIHFTDLSYENPQEAPNFCMLLRKHIQGGRILSVLQPEGERIIQIEVETVSEMGYSLNKRLIAETMGKRSNIILTDAETGKIIDSIKRISIDVNRVRQILPGLIYVRPPGGNLENSLGLGPSAKEAVASGADIKECIPRVWMEEGGRPVDVHVINLVQYDGVYKQLRFESIGTALDYFYSNRKESNRLTQKCESLIRTLNTLIDKQLLKKQRLLEEIKKSEEADTYRIKGELLTANLQAVKPGDTKVTVISYYDNRPVTIELDERLSASKNAQNLFKKYNKLKNSKHEKEPQLKACEKDIEYLESVSAMASACSSYEELDAIKGELAEQGFLRLKTGKGRKAQKTKPNPRRFTLKSGLEVAVGRNNSENDHVTFKMGEKSDWWFHGKDIHGSHLVLLCRGVDPSPEDMYEAASIAAWYSKGRYSENVPVDYAPVKHIKKPSGAKPGMVVFTNNGTVWVNPKNPED